MASRRRASSKTEAASKFAPIAPEPSTLAANSTIVSAPSTRVVGARASSKLDDDCDSIRGGAGSAASVSSVPAPRAERARVASKGEGSAATDGGAAQASSMRSSRSFDELSALRTTPTSVLGSSPREGETAGSMSPLPPIDDVRCGLAHATRFGVNLSSAARPAARPPPAEPPRPHTLNRPNTHDAHTVR